ncbi:MAG: hypothetical protein HY000_10370 [Planctomycetes bacterium]|nr:hypothetical protein [Planctomycetota bacterium]
MIALTLWLAFASAAESGTVGDIDLAEAVVLTRGDAANAAERNAAIVLIEEVERRTGIRWKESSAWLERAPLIVVASSLEAVAWGNAVPQRLRQRLRELRPEGYCLLTDGADAESGRRPVQWVVGADPRGTLFGVGHLLRQLEMRRGSVRLPAALDVATSPAYPLRGHQLGYRNRANSYDAWDDRQYEQYIRELAIFGTNAIENIPFQDRDGPHMRLPRREMNRRLSEICHRYDLEYWVWTPADFDLSDADRRQRALAEHEQLYADCARIDGVFVPGGDPGSNHPRLVLPFLQDIAQRLAKHHPGAKVWLSMQGFDADKVDSVYAFLAEQQPKWLGGIVAGPSSPAIAQTRRRLPARYGLRHYPDITHCVRCQYPIAWWDPAFAFTLGREPINPTPLYQSQIHHAFAPYTRGFLSYSDGVHDDVNKIVWTRLGWDPRTDVREILLDYARFVFGPDVAPVAADAILALERNWHGPLRTNGGVDATLALWRDLDRRAPQLRDNWRWQMCLLRAHYDCYTRHRLIYESALEDAANAALADAPARGADAGMDAALAILNCADSERCRPELRAEIEKLCDALFQSIGLQTSVERYQAEGLERGAILDSVDHPLNNRWWLEDECAAIRKLPSEEEKLTRLELIRTWENPGPGSFYDDIGNVAKSPHVIRGETPETDPHMIRNPNPDFHDAGRKRARQSWISKMDWPLGVRYDGLDPKARYVVRTTGYRDCLLRIDGERVEPTINGKEIGEFKEFPVPQPALEDGTLLLTFDEPHEPHLNWRQQSRLTEVWLLRR